MILLNNLIFLLLDYLVELLYSKVEIILVFKKVTEILRISGTSQKSMIFVRFLLVWVKKE